MTKTLVLLVLMASAAFMRIWVSSDSLVNLVPLMGIAFSAGFFLRSKAAALIPIGALLISDSVLNQRHGLGPFTLYSALSVVVYGASSFLGVWLSAKRPSFGTALGGGLLSTLTFYVVSNSLAWKSGGYPTGFSGWVMALTTGLPQYSPQTWVFLRNSLFADLSFIALVWLTSKVFSKLEERSPEQASSASLSV